MSRAVLSIGSNLGDRLAHLRGVLDALGDRVVAVSPVYTTAPWGGVEQDDFLNAVVVADDAALDGYGWLRFGQTLEQAAHRTREVRWGARTLDVDVITCVADGREISSADPELLLPHPQAHRRAFVLVPWRDVEPGATLPVGEVRRSVTALLGELPADEVAGVIRTELSLGGEGVRPWS